MIPLPPATLLSMSLFYFACQFSLFIRFHMSEIGIKQKGKRTHGRGQQCGDCGV